MRLLAFIFGVIFIWLGVAGFNADNHYLWAFKVNFPLNAFHLLSGLVACVVGCTSPKAIQLFFQIFGILYGLLGISGFVYEEQNILGMFASNPANTWLHIIAATNALIIGYGGPRE